MPRSVPRLLDTVARRLRALSVLSEAELGLVRGLNERRHSYPAGEELATETDAPAGLRFILSGWACRQRVLPDGRRQIFSFLVPGDCIGLNRRFGPELSTVVALTPVETAEADQLVEAVDAGRAPGLARALTALEPVELKLLLDHMVRLGRQTAYERLAHLLLELRHRLELVGLGDETRFPLPLTQEVMADALGLSIVHMNRTLQQLRREQLIELRSGVVILLQRGLLEAIAESRPAPRHTSGLVVVAGSRMEGSPSA